MFQGWNFDGQSAARTGTVIRAALAKFPPIT